MKVNTREYDGCFAIDLEAETLDDAAWLVRMAMNRTVELRSAACRVTSMGPFSGSIAIGKRKQAVISVPRAK